MSRRIFKAREPISPAIVSDLWKAQCGLCALCGDAMPASRWKTPHAGVWKKLRPTVDHVRPVSRGGGNDVVNLQLAHAICNKRKGAG